MGSTHGLALLLCHMAQLSVYPRMQIQFSIVSRTPVASLAQDPNRVGWEVLPRADLLAGHSVCGLGGIFTQPVSVVVLRTLFEDDPRGIKRHCAKTDENSSVSIRWDSTWRRPSGSADGSAAPGVDTESQRSFEDWSPSHSDTTSAAWRLVFDRETRSVCFSRRLFPRLHLISVVVSGSACLSGAVLSAPIGLSCSSPNLAYRGFPHMYPKPHLRVRVIGTHEAKCSPPRTSALE